MSLRKSRRRRRQRPRRRGVAWQPPRPANRPCWQRRDLGRHRRLDGDECPCWGTFQVAIESAPSLFERPATRRAEGNQCPRIFHVLPTESPSSPSTKPDPCTKRAKRRRWRCVACRVCGTSVGRGLREAAWVWLTGGGDRGELLAAARGAGSASYLNRDNHTLLNHTQRQSLKRMQTAASSTMRTQLLGRLACSSCQESRSVASTSSKRWLGVSTRNAQKNEASAGSAASAAPGEWGNMCISTAGVASSQSRVAL